MKKKNEHDFQQLLNWAEGNLSEAEAKQVEMRLAMASDDDELKTIAGWLQQFQQLSQKLTLVTPPDALTNQLTNIFTKRAKTLQQPNLFARLLATLTFDSYQTIAPVGVRATAQLERHFVYSTDLAEITVDSQRNVQEKSINLNGQLFPADDADETIYVVELQKNDVAVQITATDSLGKFVFSSLPPDQYDLVLSSEQAEILVTGIALQF